MTEDFTGAIDSINFTIASLRTLVGTLNATTAKVADAAGVRSCRPSRWRHEAAHRAAC